MVYLLGTPETSLSGRRTLNVRSMERSGPAVFPSSDFGISIGRKLKLEFNTSALNKTENKIHTQFV